MMRAWRYRHGVAAGEPVESDALADARGGAGTLLVVDIGTPTSEELDLVERQLPLHPLTMDDLRNANQRTKLEQYGDHFHVAVHDCMLATPRVQIREVDIVFGQDWLLAVRQPVAGGEPLPVDPVLRRFERGRTEPGADDLGTFLWALLDTVVDGYFDVGDAIDDRLDDIEEIVFGTELRDQIPREVFDLRRGLVRFRRAAVPLRDVLREFARNEVSWLGPESLVRMNDVLDHTMRVADMIDSQRDLLTGLLEAHLAVVSNRMNDVMKRTSSWGALILVPSLIAGIYGMNFSNMLLQNEPWGYPVMMVATGLLTLALYSFFRRRAWL